MTDALTKTPKHVWLVGAIALVFNSIGLFDFVMYFVQMAVPATELGWTPDLLILVAVTAAITAAGSRNLSRVGAG